MALKFFVPNLCYSFLVGLFMVFGLILPNYSYGQKLQVNFGKTVKEHIKSGAASANLCWLTDSDIHYPDRETSMREALEQLGVGSLRFPYGHLADNYLWHSPPYENTDNGLRPKVAAPSRPPMGWDWAVDAEGYFTSAMDFDEYMQLCQALDIAPLVVINIFSFTYEGGPTKDELLTAAVEWVRYAKQQNYKVAYWQIGNEVDHHKNWISPEEYIELYQTFTSRMKAVDKDIKTGPGILSDTSYFNRIVERYPDLINFTSSHQYAWPYIKSCSTYQKWKGHKDDYVPNVRKMQKAVEDSSKPDLDIVVTETGVTPMGKGMGDVNNTYKALWYFEMLMNEISLPNHAYSYFWGTHSPWNGLEDNPSKDVGVLLRMDDNSQKPIAQVVELINDNILDDMVATTKIEDYIRLFASRDAKNGKVNLFIVNRNDRPQDIQLSLRDIPGGVKQLQGRVLYGKHPESTELHNKNLDPVEIIDGTVDMSVAPLSITLLESR